MAIGQWSAIYPRLRRLMQPKPQGAGLPERCSESQRPDEWICIFDGRAGARARAVFDTRDRAIRFAEQHARALTPAGLPLKWEDAKTSAVSTTQLGDYLVISLGVASRNTAEHGRVAVASRG